MYLIIIMAKSFNIRRERKTPGIEMQIMRIIFRCFLSNSALQHTLRIYLRSIGMTLTTHSGCTRVVCGFIISSNAN